MKSKSFIKILTFQEKKVIKKIEKDGFARVPLSFCPREGRGTLFNPDFKFGYNWIRAQMKARNKEYNHDNYPYWGIFLPESLRTEEKIEDISEIFCEPGRLLLELNVPESECLFSSFDSFDAYVLRKRFFGSEEEILSFYRQHLKKEKLQFDQNIEATFENLSLKAQKDILFSFEKVILQKDMDLFCGLYSDGDYVQVTIPEIKKEYIVSD
jgi:hypothetical protein